MKFFQSECPFFINLSIISRILREGSKTSTIDLGLGEAEEKVEDSFPDGPYNNKKKMKKPSRKSFLLLNKTFEKEEEKEGRNLRQNNPSASQIFKGKK